MANPTSPYPLYFGPRHDLFGWIQLPATIRRDTAVVICNPIGFEYVRTHRAVRFLATGLTSEGFAVMRFDYHGTGDSSGTDKDENRTGAWIESIGEAASRISSICGLEKIAFVGLRLGATLSGRLAESFPASQLVFWNPCVAGKSFVREMQIVASADLQRGRRSQSESHKSARDSAAPGIDAAGFLLTADTIRQLNDFELGNKPFVGSPPILLIERDGLPQAQQLASKLASVGSDVTHKTTNEYSGMMLPPQFSVIPVTSIEKICSWLGEQCEEGESNNDSYNAILSQFTPALRVAPEISDSVSERADWFGSEKRLFGITSFNSNGHRAGHPAVVMLCGGSVHRVSANRMYTPMARSIAARGFNVLRMDLSGIGDSQPIPDTQENRPYSKTLNVDVEAAMDHLTEIFGTEKFVILGLCSGAYAATCAAASSDRVAELILINQLVYYLKPGDLDANVAGQFEFENRLDFPRTSGIVDRAIRKLLSATSPAIGWPGNYFSWRMIGGPLSKDLHRLVNRGVYLAFIHSEGDAACDALMLPAGNSVNELMSSGNATRHVFENTDHTFSSSAAQSALTDWLYSHLCSRWIESEQID